MNILDTIAENTRQRYKEIIKNKPLAKVKAEALEMPKGNFEFEKALGGDTLSFICEVKKASPSKGVIAEDFPYLQIAKEYEKNPKVTVVNIKLVGPVIGSHVGSGFGIITYPKLS